MHDSGEIASQRLEKNVWIPTGTLKEKIAQAPKQPGCYLFLDEQGRVIYVGKSKLLHNRVRQYFHPASQTDERIRYLVKQIAGVAYVRTQTETDALMQEYRLIKKYRPWFNSQLKRDRVHPYIRVDRRCEYPTLSIAYEAQEDGAAYFGCFHDDLDAEQALETLSKVWKTPRCNTIPLPRKTCLYYELHTCMGPCESKTDAALYRAAIEEIVSCLQGEPVKAFERLHCALQAAAAELAFEKAQDIQQTIEELKRLQYRGKRLKRLPKEGTIFALVRAYREPCFSVFHIKDGVLVNRARLDQAASAPVIQRKVERVLKVHKKMPGSEWMLRCIAEFYADKQYIVMAEDAKETEMFAKILEGVEEFIHGHNG